MIHFHCLNNIHQAWIIGKKHDIDSLHVLLKQVLTLSYHNFSVKKKTKKEKAKDIVNELNRLVN